MPEILDEPAVVKIDPATIKTATPVESRVVDPATIQPKTDPKALFNDMAKKLGDALKGKTDVVKPIETKTNEKIEDNKEIKDENNVGRKSEDWRKLHSRVKEIEAKSENLGKELASKIAEIEALKKQPQIDPKELETLKTEKQQLASELERVALEQTPAFKNYYEKKFNKSIAMAKESVGAEAADSIEHLLNLAPSKARKESLAEVLENLPTELDRLNLARAVQDMDEARSERNEALSKSKENLAKANEAAQTERTKQMNSHKQRVSEKIDAVLKLGTNFDAFKKIEGDQAHNDAIAGREANVRRALSGEMAENEIAVIPLLAEEAIFLKQRTVPGLEAKIKSLEEAIAKLSGAEPGGGHGDPSGAKNGTKPKSVIDVFRENYQGPARRTS